MDRFRLMNLFVRIVETGRSNNLRHLQRTHRVNFSWFTECKKRGLFTIQYCDTKSQAADIFTKSSHDSSTWKHLLKLICHVRSGKSTPLQDYNKKGASVVNKDEAVFVQKKRKKQRRSKPPVIPLAQPRRDLLVIGIRT